MKKCWRCKRRRLAKYINTKVNANGKESSRCRARSVCASMARRNKLGRGPNSVN